MDIYARDNVDASVAQVALDVSNYKTTAMDETNVHREYMVREACQQYRDYYESDAEEHGFFEYLDNLTNRDRIRFMEIGEDFSLSKDPPTMLTNGEMKEYGMIPKREFNPELSAFSNLTLDLLDFKDRVRPQARDMALFDASRPYQRAAANLENISKMDENDEFRRYLNEKDDQTDEDRKMLKMMDHNATLSMEDKKRSFVSMIEQNKGRSVDDLMANLVENFVDANQTVEEGYSSIEIPAETDSEQVHAAEAEPVIEEAVEAAEAEPVIEEVVEEAAEEATPKDNQEDEEKK
jgi:hypothetical protein